MRCNGEERLYLKMGLQVPIMLEDERYVLIKRGFASEVVSKQLKETGIFFFDMQV